MPQNVLFSIWHFFLQVLADHLKKVIETCTRWLWLRTGIQFFFYSQKCRSQGRAPAKTDLLGNTYAGVDVRHYGPNFDTLRKFFFCAHAMTKPLFGFTTAQALNLDIPPKKFKGDCPNKFSRRKLFSAKRVSILGQMTDILTIFRVFFRAFFWVPDIVKVSNKCFLNLSVRVCA